MACARAARTASSDPIGLPQNDLLLERQQPSEALRPQVPLAQGRLLGLLLSGLWVRLVDSGDDLHFLELASMKKGVSLKPSDAEWTPPLVCLNAENPLEGINWPLLTEQLESLRKTIQGIKIGPDDERRRDLWGIVMFLEALQMNALKSLSFEEVLGPRGRFKK